MDREPVSNAEFARFLKASGYKPADAHNFLKDWPDWKNGVYPNGAGNRPVTWVSIEDARAYAKWAGKRLPHEWEWQYAAQGSDGRLYPWGDWEDSGRMPYLIKGRKRQLPANNGAHPKSASPFGVEDLVGDVWQWTDEFRDEHTRAAIVRGGSSYRPQSADDRGTNWYFPPTSRLDQHGKYLLMAPSIDRSGMIGFRCVVDAKP
jgi:formylglycine-generating enzyme required for sulfatase activity